LDSIYDFAIPRDIVQDILLGVGVLNLNLSPVIT